MQIDAALAAKLAKVLNKIAHGKPLAVAAVEAGLGASEVARVMKELERELWARAREADEPADPRTKATKPEKKPAKKKPAKGSKKAGGLSLIAYADGGSRGNPGKAACAALICDVDGAELLRRAKLIGKATNNVAEYQGVLLALELCRELGATDVTLRLDSELVVRQLEGRYRVKHAALAPLYENARELTKHFKSLDVEHVPRNQNKVADALVNAALDGKELD
jgi:ribonuclease HI